MVFGMVSQPLFAKVQAKLSSLNTILQENLAGIKVVKAFAREAEEASKFDASAEDYMQQQITVARVFSFLFPVIFLIANLGQALVLYFGGRQILAGTLTIGEWQKFSLYLASGLLPHRPARLHHQPDERSQRQRQPHLRDPGRIQRRDDKPDAVAAAAHQRQCRV
jgi:ATP-binding cassette subfamily B multidrug efflux pump